MKETFGKKSSKNNSKKWKKKKKKKKRKNNKQKQTNKQKQKKKIKKQTRKEKYLKIQIWVCQNVFNKVLLAWFKFQSKIPSHSVVCVQADSMNIRNLKLGVNSVMVSYLIRYGSLLQNVTDFITKCDRIFLQNASGFLL